MSDQPEVPNCDLVIRRVSLPDHISRSTLKVLPKLFKPRRGEHGEGISVTACKQEIATQQNVDDYLEVSSVGLETHLGCVFLRRTIIAKHKLELEPDEQSQPFGHLHELLKDPSEDDLCPGPDTRSHLAQEATFLNHVRLCKEAQETRQPPSS